jgi:hypothetical protein
MSAAAPTNTNPLPKSSEQHKKVLEYVKNRLRLSEYAMQKFYPRWTANERRAQAYVTLPDYERLLKEQNEAGGAPQIVTITIPHSYATIATMVTYWLHTFAGRSPMFPVRSHQGEKVKNALSMEILLQYNADHTRFIKWLYHWLQDAALYGVGIMRSEFVTKDALRTVMKNPADQTGAFGRLTGSQPYKARETRTVYQGPIVESVDPFMFFPDPRVPMCEVNKKGEFVFWRSFVGKHILKKGEQDGIYFDVDQVDTTLPKREIGDWLSLGSARSVLTGGDPYPGSEQYPSAPGGKNIPQYYQIDEGTLEITPSELGLETLAEEAGVAADYPSKWLVTMANGNQIIRLAAYDHDHAMHPVAVTEPYSFGYGFGQPAATDFIAPFQDIMSWLLNSHMANVRAAINNSVIVDPSRIEMQDLKAKTKGGRIIRLKRAAYGQDVQTAIQQLQIVDMTRGHLADMAVIQRLADAITGVNDNTRGIQDSGGRKTATEVRVSSDSGASRLAATSRVISAQGMVDVTQQMCLDNQQFLEQTFQIQVLGGRALEAPVTVGPDEIVGDFYFPINDGTLPIDRVAMFDLWQQLFQVLITVQPLAAQYDIPRIFEWIADLGGARNIEQFRVSVVPDMQAQQDASAGNAIPANAVVQGLGGPKRGRPNGAAQPGLSGNYMPTELGVGLANGQAPMGAM